MEVQNHVCYFSVAPHHHISMLGTGTRDFNSYVNSFDLWHPSKGYDFLLASKASILGAETGL